MPEYSATVEGWLRGATVRLVILVTLDFASGPVRLCSDDPDCLVDGDLYQGGGRLVGLSGIEDAAGHAAPDGSVTLSGTEPRFVEAALDGAHEVLDREIVIAMQFLDEASQPFDPPDVLVVGTMGVPRLRGRMAERTVEIPYERDTARRAKAPFGNWSDRDQQRIYPGDRGFERMPIVKPKTVKLIPL